ncbi:hypothetical protein [uncultured Alloprevotella sp.]|uniref:hypothetical protein n=1 Tax=uncultured Alloprevotella sp. TaxID=1283315 RepID=UPI00261C73E9|nr:hypothetical protein [uncultured Alloprevotella sp.]
MLHAIFEAAKSLATLATSVIRRIKSAYCRYTTLRYLAQSLVDGCPLVMVRISSRERKGVRSREDTLFITVVNEEKAMSLLETQCKWLKTKLEGLEDEA